MQVLHKIFINNTFSRRNLCVFRLTSWSTSQMTHTRRMRSYTWRRSCCVFSTTRSICLYPQSSLTISFAQFQTHQYLNRMPKGSVNFMTHSQESSFLSLFNVIGLHVNPCMRPETHIGRSKWPSVITRLTVLCLIWWSASCERIEYLSWC